MTNRREDDMVELNKDALRYFINNVISPTGNVVSIRDTILAAVAEKVLLSPEVSDTYPDPATGERLPRFVPTQPATVEVKGLNGVALVDVIAALKIIVEANTRMGDGGPYVVPVGPSNTVTGERLAAWRTLRAALGLPI